MSLYLINYWVAIALLLIGLYIVMSREHLIKKVVGLSIFQTAVFIMYISMGKVFGGSPPIVSEEFSVYSNPLPHVLILTAIVVGVATTAVGLALAVRIREAYGTLNEDDILKIHDEDAT